MLDNKLYLIFVKPIIGDDYTSYKMYFSDNPDEAIGENWEKVCSSDVGKPEPQFIDKICMFKSFNRNLETLYDNDFYTYLHGVYNIIPLVYENVDEIIRGRPNDLPEKIFLLKYGEEYESVLNKMNNYDLILKELKIA